MDVLKIQPEKLPMAERSTLWTVTDPRGLDVSLADDVWQEHVAYRPELAAYLAAVALTVQDPDAIYFDPATTAHRTTGARIYLYYRSGLTKGKYADTYIAVVIKVLPHNDHAEHGYVESAMLSNRIMRRAVLEWKRE